MMIKEVMHEIYHFILNMHPTLSEEILYDALFHELVVAKIDDALDLVFEGVLSVNERND
tara:strand:- start:7641 stop:7817 length:177 start_codon:yes stop_codon:yes gene_type:complete